MKNRLINLLREGPLLGLYNAYPSEGLLETVAPGWDFVWIDAQHGQFSIDSALRAVRTAAAIGVESVLRVPSRDAGLLGQYADTAAAGVMVPQVDTVKSATDVMEALRFPPRGKRSFGGRRAVDRHGRDYYLMYQPTVVVQIESREGLENAGPIASVDGIDALFLGLDDLRLSLGLSIDTPIQESDVLLRARRAVATAARAAGKLCGATAANPQDLRELLELGYRLICCGSDVGFLRAGSQVALEQHRRVREEVSAPSASK